MEGKEENKKKGKLERRFYQQRFFPTAEKTGLTDYRSVIQYIYDAGTYAYGKGEAEKPSSDPQKQEKATSSTLAKETLRLRNTAVLNLKLKQKIFAYEKERLRKLRVILPPDPVDAPPEDEDVVVKKEKDPFKLPKFKWPKPPRKPPTKPPTTTPPPPAPVTPGFEFNIPWYLIPALLDLIRQGLISIPEMALSSARAQESAVASASETIVRPRTFAKRYRRARSNAIQGARGANRASSRAAARNLARELAEGGGTSKSGSPTATATRTGKGSGTGAGTGKGPFAQSRPNKGGSSPTGPKGPPKLPTLKIGGFEIGGFSERIPKDVAQRLAKDLQRLKVPGFKSGTLAELRAALPSGYVIEGLDKAQSKIVPGPGGPVITNATGEVLEEALKKLDKPKTVKVDPARVLGQLDKSTQTTADVISKTSKSTTVKPTVQSSVAPRPSTGILGGAKNALTYIVKNPRAAAVGGLKGLASAGLGIFSDVMLDNFFSAVESTQARKYGEEFRKQSPEIQQKEIKRLRALMEKELEHQENWVHGIEKVIAFPSRRGETQSEYNYRMFAAKLTAAGVPLTDPVSGKGNYKFGYNLPPTNTLAGQNYGASREGGARKHAGVDFDISGNATFPTQIGGVVTHIGKDPGGYGIYVDIYNEKLGVTERIAEAAKLISGIKVGRKLTAGTPVVQGESETGVIHYEIRQGGGAGVAPTFGFEGTQDPIEFLKKNVSQPGSERKVGQKAILKGKPVKWDGDKWIPDVPPEQKVSVLPINKDTTVDQDPILDQNVNFDVASFKIPALTPQVEYIPVPVPMPEPSKSIASVQNSPAWGNTSLLGA